MSVVAGAIPVAPAAVLQVTEQPEPEAPMAVLVPPYPSGQPVPVQKFSRYIGLTIETLPGAGDRGATANCLAPRASRTEYVRRSRGGGDLAHVLPSWQATTYMQRVRGQRDMRASTGEVQLQRVRRFKDLRASPGEECM